MIGRIEIEDGRAGWPRAAPLLEAVWPPEVVAALPWKDVVWAPADRRVLVFDCAGEIIGHAVAVDTELLEEVLALTRRRVPAAHVLSPECR